MRRALCLSIALVIAGGACALPSADEFAGGRAATDGGSSSGASSSASSGVDAAPDPSALGDASTSLDADTSDARPQPIFENLVKNPDFESGSCVDVGFYQAVGTDSTDAHAGHGACQVCRSKVTFDAYTFNPYVVLPNPTVGTRYVAHAWVKLGPNSYKDQSVGIIVRTHQNNPYVLIEQSPDNPVPLTSTWTYLESSMVLTKPAESLDLVVYSSTAATAGERCFIFDDVGLFLE
jgi:hypothetical protein